MTKGFETLEEYQALRDNEKIDLQAIAPVMDRLSYGKLNGVLSVPPLFAKIQCRRWQRELEKVLGAEITLHMTEEEIVPYMREDGVLCFCKKDLKRREKLFMLLAHESAHFILMRDKNYGQLKKVDTVYRAVSGRECKMHSPVEECANLVTLLILDRCKQGARKKTQKIIERCIKSLKNQLTK